MALDCLSQSLRKSFRSPARKREVENEVVTEDTSSSWGQLPHHILYLVHDLLLESSPDVSMTLRSVCQGWRLCLCHRVDAMAPLRLDAIQGQDILQAIGTRFQSLTSLDLKNLGDQVADEGLMHLSTITRLKTFNAPGCSLQSLDFMRRMTQLRHVGLAGCQELRDEALAALQGRSSVTCLDLAHCDALTDIALTQVASMPNLTWLVLASCYGVSDAGLESLTGLTSVTRLDLSNCHHVTDVGLNFLAQIPHLAHLVLAGCYHVIHLSPLSSLTELAHLDVSDCSMIGDEGLQRLSRLSGLTHLNLKDSKLSDDGCGSLSRVTTLVHLDLSFCRNITGAGVLALTSLRRLSTLKLHGCDSSTAPALPALLAALPLSHLALP
eukprot:evm.model.scf_3986.1 EVM.evm.TU.scf_3986.1   scf_3986:3556-5900(-)